ncbi:MAG: RNA polymerase sigma factor [Sedimentisphaerales bacterium]|nr:RNA polymerase sigma factor [Sedimentisphaerales bacterium]
MIENKKQGEWVRKAQLGDKDCLNRLAEIAKVHLYEYVFRLTLEEDLTQDIVQECILEMFKVFHKLRKADRFLAWLEGIAFNKIRSHYGRKWRHKTVSLSKTGFDMAAEDSQMVVADMVNRELKDIILQSMLELEPRQRAILALRCYKDMPYSEIARLMGCTEFGAQSLFYRAKKALAKKLSSHGLGKGYLLTALVLFGKLTSTTEAAAAKISVTAATIKVGTAASLTAIATSKTAVVSFATAAAIACAAAAITLGTDDGPQKSVTSMPITEPLLNSVSEGAEQCWYFFPEGADGPVMMRFLQSDDSGKDFSCQYLQNQHANYHCNKGAIYVSNSRMFNPDLSVQRLPTDSEALSRFISRVEGRETHMETVPNRRKGLLVISERSGDSGDRVWRIGRHTNVLEEEYFQSDWPVSTRKVDQRDAMHKRGWTYFTITGRIKGKPVSGTGRIPFVYEANQLQTPWLELHLGGGGRIVDTGTGAYVVDGSRKVVARYEGGSFFEGLGRPWMGLHTIDTVRRDAAERQVWFETQYKLPDDKAEVVVTCDQVELVYTIDMETDVIDKITFEMDGVAVGELVFSYLQDINDVGRGFTEPKVTSSRGSKQNPPGILWLSNLVMDRW